MPITVLSPFSGQPVKIRDQDISRAVRDEENRIFYVLQKSDGSGYYAAATRAGGEEAERKYLALEQKTGQSSAQVQGEVAALHDATGKRRGGKGKLLAVVVIVILAAAAYFAWSKGLIPGAKPTPAPTPTDTAPVDE